MTGHFHTDENLDLDWLAFCYVTDEMTAGEAEAFEQMLADDQQAREALARAVPLSQALCAAGREAVVSPGASSYWLRPMGWIALGAAACLAMVLLYPSGPEQVSQTVPEAPGPARGAVDTDLAVAWARSSLPEPISSDDQALLEEHDPLASDATTEPHELLVPGWMLEAVSGQPEMMPASEQEET